MAIPKCIPWNSPTEREIVAWNPRNWILFSTKELGIMEAYLVLVEEISAKSSGHFVNWISKTFGKQVSQVLTFY
jgi:hypothetical protein